MHPKWTQHWPQVIGITCTLLTSKWPSLMSRQNLRDPATLQRSPMLTKLVKGPTVKGSSPGKLILNNWLIDWLIQTCENHVIWFFTFRRYSWWKSFHCFGNCSNKNQIPRYKFRRILGRLTDPMCSGVVPQQPPTILTNPCSANSAICSAVMSGVSSYSPKVLGRPRWVKTIMRR